MSNRQKQTEMFFRKIGGLTEKSVPGQNNPSNIVPQSSDKSIVCTDASYGLRSLDKKLASLILEILPQLDQKSARKLRGVAVSRRFKNFEALVNKDPQLAQEIIKEKLSETMWKTLFGSAFKFSDPSDPSDPSVRSEKEQKISDPSDRSDGQKSSGVQWRPKRRF